MAVSYITLAEFLEISGGTYTTAEQSRIEALIPMVSAALRSEAVKVGKDLDAMIADDEDFESVVQLVCVDVIVRAMSLNTDSEPMSQESQSALGYSWSGTYAVPGGGIANCIMRNDLKRLGLKRQRFGVIEWYGDEDDDAWLR